MERSPKSLQLPPKRNGPLFFLAMTSLGYCLITNRRDPTQMFKLFLLIAFLAFCVADNMWDEKGFTPAGDKEKVLCK
ncbi:hypothetical protein EON65_31180 [archaeon]|nr:MAG: hypothetical protein EON65_31180 [archaeon]